MTTHSTLRNRTAGPLDAGAPSSARALNARQCVQPLLVLALLGLLAPAALAAKTAPTRPAYTARLIPNPTGWDGYQIDDINARGDGIGFALNRMGRGSSYINGPGIFWNRGTNALHFLPPLAIPLHNASKPLGLSDNGKVVFGVSMIEPSTGANYDETPMLWVDPGNGDFVSIELEAKLLAFAPNSPCAPWGFDSFRYADVHLAGVFRGSLLTADARYLVLEGMKTVTWGLSDPEVGVVVRLDWTNPLDPVITGMWPIGSIPNPSLGASGYRGYPYSIRNAVENAGTASEREIVIVSGRYWEYAADGTTTIRRVPMVWELEPASGASTPFPLNASGGGSLVGLNGNAFDVNALGEAVGLAGPENGTWDGHYWNSLGIPFKPALLSSTTDSRFTAINDSGLAVGFARGRTSVPIIWNARTPNTAPRDLKQLAGGKVPIEVGVDINASGEILAVDWNDTLNKFYLLTPVAP